MVIVENIHMVNNSMDMYASGIYTERGAGMNQIRSVKRAKDIPFRCPDKIVGTFGIVGDNGVSHIYGWKVSGWRRDKRHGVVDEPTPQSDYTISLYERMFKRW